jgi:hypothetical protein
LADIFREAARLNGDDARRRGNVVELAPGREVLVAGDLHGHGRNLERIIAYADLGENPRRRLILQEIVHGPPDEQTGRDRSVDVLLRAARLKIAHPEGVIFLLGNHDVAQATGSEIAKAGRGVCRSFVEGTEHAVGSQDAPDVLNALSSFLLSVPLAARTPGGVLICHSLPSPRRMALAGKDIPDGPYDPQALRRGGRVYEWIWGRGQTPQQIDRLAQHLGVTFFVLGHRPVGAGYEAIGPRAVILTAEHDQGYILQFSSDAALSRQDLPVCLKRIAALADSS